MLAGQACGTYSQLWCTDAGQLSPKVRHQPQSHWLGCWASTHSAAVFTSWSQLLMYWSWISTVKKVSLLTETWNRIFEALSKQHKPSVKQWLHWLLGLFIIGYNFHVSYRLKAASLFLSLCILNNTEGVQRYSECWQHCSTLPIPETESPVLENLSYRGVHQQISAIGAASVLACFFSCPLYSFSLLCSQMHSSCLSLLMTCTGLFNWIFSTPHTFWTFILNMSEDIFLTEIVILFYMADKDIEIKLLSHTGQDELNGQFWVFSEVATLKRKSCNIIFLNCRAIFTYWKN